MKIKQLTKVALLAAASLMAFQATAAYPDGKPIGAMVAYGPGGATDFQARIATCLLYTSPSPRDQRGSRMPSSA